jgi:hypothetical protein
VPSPVRIERQVSGVQICDDSVDWGASVDIMWISLQAVRSRYRGQ